MKQIYINAQNKNRHREKLWAYFALRKRVFIDQYRWALEDFDGFEIDQYDDERAEYVLYYQYDRLLGGCRFLRTDRIGTSWSYMIRDAMHGRLSNIPASIVTDAPINKAIYESTRFVIDTDLSPERQYEVIAKMIDANLDLFSQLGAKLSLSLSPPSYAALLKRMGHTVIKLGPVIGKGATRFLAIATGDLDWYRGYQNQIPANAIASSMGQIYDKDRPVKASL